MIVVSNDDMVKIDTAKALQEQLLALDKEKCDVVFTEPSNCHSVPMQISQHNILYFLYHIISNKNERQTAMMIHKKFGIRYLMAPIFGTFSKVFRKGYQYLEIQDFGIYNPIWISEMGSSLYDDTFIISAEDSDLSLRVSIERVRTSTIKYKIGDLIESTLGTGVQRELRDIACIAYFNWKWSNQIDEKIKRSVRSQ